MAGLLKEWHGEDLSGKVLDPACGDGGLLDAAGTKLSKAKLYGVDIDSSASRSAYPRLCLGITIMNVDMLISPILGKGAKPVTFGAVTSNPSWGPDILHSRPYLKEISIHIG